MEVPKIASRLLPRTLVPSVLEFSDSSNLGEGNSIDQNE
jgi:hypothetical protein